MSGGLAGLVAGPPSGLWLAGLALGAVGAAAGTFGGHAARLRLAASVRRDWPAALIEDAVAIGLGLGAVYLAGAG